MEKVFIGLLALNVSFTSSQRLVQQNWEATYKYFSSPTPLRNCRRWISSQTEWQSLMMENLAGNIAEEVHQIFYSLMEFN